MASTGGEAGVTGGHKTEYNEKFQAIDCNRADRFAGAFQEEAKLVTG